MIAGPWLSLGSDTGIYGGRGMTEERGSHREVVMLASSFQIAAVVVRRHVVRRRLLRMQDDRHI